ncbi:U-scoloptoxin(01)-Cw1a-like [Ornithodoros turicata]|uniref:U-scoloptoxin(01)-Cw1a-like n=1 Tax=Ornithodoros turicata TaxID=34597 RepID=UPI0031395EB0
MMKVFLLLASIAVAVAVSKSRSKRQAYELPDGVEFVVGGIQTRFQCQRGGYFADVDNNCQIFHICNEVFNADGSYEIKQYSFFCGNQTIFNQLSLTCAFPEESVPCANAQDFFYINDNIGRENTPLHTEDDLARAAPLIPGFQQPQQQFAAAASERKEQKVAYKSKA